MSTFSIFSSKDKWTPRTFVWFETHVRGIFETKNLPVELAQDENGERVQNFTIPRRPLNFDTVELTHY